MELRETRKALTQIRHYLNNGFPENRKNQLRDLQRKLELRLDKEAYKTANRAYN